MDNITYGRQYYYEMEAQVEKDSGLASLHCSRCEEAPSCIFYGDPENIVNGEFRCMKYPRGY